MQDGGDSLLCRDDFVRRGSRRWLASLVSCVSDCISYSSFLRFRQTTQPHSGSRTTASEGVERSLVLLVRQRDHPARTNIAAHGFVTAG